MTVRLNAAIKDLPPDAVEEVADFAEFLAARTTPRPTAGMTLSWRGALKSIYPDKDSVTLQHEMQRHWLDAAED